MGKVITDWHWDRIKGLIETRKGKVVCGGKVYRSIKYVEPTILLNPEDKSPVMQQEILSPVIPIITLKNID